MVNLKNIEHNLKRFQRLVKAVKSIDYKNLEDEEILSLSLQLRERAKAGEAEGSFVITAFGLAFEAVRRALSITTHDNQIMAAAAMAEGFVIELATGEGKTLAAVFTVFLKALSGKGVHVLTFNDYLARRDASWMRPVYERLGISVGCIVEASDRLERKTAYAADVTYVTAREAGFDYLRGFLGYVPEDVVHRPFHFAVIDEADSTLIDEARIPLVIAGDIPDEYDIDEKLFEYAAQMKHGVHFGTDENGGVVYLEDAGIAFLEEQLKLSNLYDGGNLELVGKAVVIIQALHFLKRDVDYIVRDDEILLVDEYTGRVAPGRQWSEGLHAAVELKEGLKPKNQGKVMNSITLQNFLRLYPDFSGMTGTAVPAAAEMLRFYNRNVAVMPPHRGCIREDKPDVIFTHKQAKYDAVAAETVRAHMSGRPVLIGTSSVEESELLADMLRGHIPGIAVLNAKNDAAEAEVVAGAGQRHAVTISTNMAGRGVDIVLGGQNRTDYEAVCALGGLYVIGLNRHESVRVDNQLRGRAGRQGDPGESRFFISLEDNLVVRYGLYESIPEKLRDKKSDLPLTNPQYLKSIVHTQKVVEGQLFDAKVTLFKYAGIVEDQRKIVHKRRADILFGRIPATVLYDEDPVLYEKICTQVGIKEQQRAERIILLYAINSAWSDHLLFLDSLQDEAQMIGQVKGDPLTYYNKKLIDGFGNLEDNIRKSVIKLFRSAVIRNGSIELDEMGVRGPTSTRTFMVHDGTEGLNMLGGIGEIGAAFSAPLYFLNLLLTKLKKKNK